MAKKFICECDSTSKQGCICEAENFECCIDCDLPDACSDFGCAIKQGIRTPNEF